MSSKAGRRRKMQRKMYKILARKKDCVLLKRTLYENGHLITKYLVKDIEGDVIYMDFGDEEGARRVFDEYDLEEIRKEKNRSFELWLKENAEA